MLNHHDLEDLTPSKAYDTKREAKDNAAQGFQVDDDTIIEQYENAKMRYEMLGMLNTAQLSTKGKIEQTKQYRQAYKDLIELETIVYRSE